MGLIITFLMGLFSAGAYHRWYHNVQYENTEILNAIIGLTVVVAMLAVATIFRWRK